MSRRSKIFFVRSKLGHFHTFYFFLSCPIYLKSCKSAKKSFISSLAHKTKTSQDTIDNRDVERLRQLFREVETWNSKYHVHNVVWFLKAADTGVCCAKLRAHLQTTQFWSVKLTIFQHKKSNFTFLTIFYLPHVSQKLSITLWLS